MDASFCPELDAMLRSRSAVGQSGRVFEGLGALSTVNNLAVLRSLMLERKPEQTLEVGLSFGGSALTIAASHRDLGHAANQPHTAFDPFQSSAWDNTGLAALARAGLDGFVDHRAERSAEGLARLASEGRTFDLVYIDGSHLFDDVFVDAYFGFRLLSETGLALFDDSSTPHVAKVLSFIRSNWNGWTEEVDLSDVHPAGATMRHQLGKHLGRLQLRAFRRTGVDSRAWDAPLRRF